MTHRTVAAAGVRLHVAGGGGGEADRPALFVVPGYTDHLGRYAETFSRFLAAGYPVWGMDPRGHGLSGGQRGYVRRFSVYVDDLALALGSAAQAEPERDWVVVAHSTGALVTLAALLERGAVEPFRRVVGAVLTCPLLRIRRHVSPLHRFAARVGSILFPRLSLPAAPDYANTHDPEAERARWEDPLMFKTVNARWYMEMQRAMEALAPRAPEVKVPLLGLQAADDRVVDPAAARDFFARCPEARYVEYPGMYHEILLETDRERVWDDIEAWLAGLRPRREG